jgi:glutathione S-transferase
MAFRQQTFGFTLSDQAMDYVDTLLHLPAMQHWYDEALQESWRDEPHDKQISERGNITEDLRAN